MSRQRDNRNRILMWAAGRFFISLKKTELATTGTDARRLVSHVFLFVTDSSQPTRFIPQKSRATVRSFFIITHTNPREMEGAASQSCGNEQTTLLNPSIGSSNQMLVNCGPFFRYHLVV